MLQRCFLLELKGYCADVRGVVMFWRLFELIEEFFPL